MARTRRKRKRNETERRKGRSHTKVEGTGKYKRSEIIPRNHTIYGKILTETFGTNRPIEKTTEKEQTMEIGTGTRNGL